MSRIFITGIGVITAIGNNAAENRASLINGFCGINKNTKYPSKYASLLPFGEIGFSNTELKNKFNIQHPGATRTSLLAIHAMEEAINDARLSSEDVANAAFISATTVGGMDETDSLRHDIFAKDNPSPFVGCYDVSDSTVFIQEHYGIQGFADTINTACSSSSNAVMYGTNLIKNKLAKRAIVGGVDCLSKMTINGFNALQILSDELCRPFDKDRKGLNLGEGAAYIILEREEDCRHKKIYAEIKGFGNANDAFHPSSTSDNGDGPFLAIQAALEFAALQPNEIDFVIAHGTATENNDITESKAMMRLFREVPSFFSAKANIGHTLGAAGIVNAVYAIMSLDNQEIYPAVNFKTAIEETELVPNSAYQPKPLKHAMANAFGFGGNCTSLIFSKV